MIKPLLKVIPALSGNVKLACELNKYTQIDDNTFSVISRKARLYPLSSNMFQNPIDISLLHSNWEYDIVKFYHVYSDIFYKNTFEYDKNNYLKVYSLGNIINDRNVDFEFGCKRVSYQKTEKQLCFFAPIYCDNVNDLPDYFEITIEITNKDLYKAKKVIRVDLGNDITNYLGQYLKRYFSKINDNVIFMKPDSSQALYYGVDVKFGGLNSYVDNLISQNFNYETTINGYDANISAGFKRNGLILQQIMPLSFYFSIDDVLTEQERKKYLFSDLHISGAYYKDNNQVQFYHIDDNYEKLSIPTLVTNRNTGRTEYIYNYSNLLDINDTLSLSTTNVEEYKFSNKINKFYNRWMLKYSSVNNPYIINTNYNFSKNQNLQNMYYQSPQNYYWSSVLCNVVNNNVNVLLPIGSNISEYYSEYEYLVNKYFLSLNNYITNWFDMTENLDINYIIDNTNWGDVHNDGKIFYKGILYDFNKIYNKLDNSDTKIDKFAILYYVDDSDLFTNSTINNYILASEVMTYSPISLNANVSSPLLTNDKQNILYYTYNSNVKNSYLNYKYELNQYFTYNTYGAGKYINLEDIGIDYYEVNKYYRINNEIIPQIYNLMDSIISNYKITKNIEKPLYENTLKLKNSIIESFELLEIPYVSNIIDILDDIKKSNYGDYIYYTTNNHNIYTPIKNLDLSGISESDKHSFYKYVFYIKGYFIHNIIYYDYIGDVLDTTNFYQENRISEIQSLLRTGININYNSEFEYNVNWDFPYPYSIQINNSPIGPLLVDEVNITNVETKTIYIDENIIKETVFEYKYYPYFELDTNKTLYNIFVYSPKKHRFYGNSTSIDNKELDKDILYVDTHNMDELSYYHILHGNMYIKNIKDNYITLSDIVSEQNIYLIVNNSTNMNLLLNELEYTYTYVGYYSNKYNVEKLIKTINSIYIYNQKYTDNYGYTSYSLDYNNAYYEVSSTSYYTNLISQPIVAYTYNIRLTDTLLTDNITTETNIYKDNTSVVINAYSYFIDYNNFDIKLANYDGYTFTVHCNDIDSTYKIAYNLGACSYLKLTNGDYKYVTNLNTVGTYYFTYSYLFGHPQQIIKSIDNLPYISKPLSVESNNDIYISDKTKFNVIKYTAINDGVKLYNPKVNETEIQIDSFWDYISSNTETIEPNDDAIELIDDTNDNDDKTETENVEKTNTFIKVKNLDFLQIYFKYFNIKTSGIRNIFIRIKLFDYTYNLTSYYIQEQKRLTELYNESPINLPNNHIFNSFIRVITLGFGDAEELLNNIQFEEDGLFSLSDGYKRNLLSQLFGVGGHDKYNLDTKLYVELFISRSCFPISKTMLTKVIGLNTDKYKDMYIYKLEKDNDQLSNTKYFNLSSIYKDKLYLNVLNNVQTPVLVPFFDNVYEQDEKDTVLYKSYIINEITEMQFNRQNVVPMVFYRYNMPDKIMMYDVSSLCTPYDNKPSIIYNTENEKVTYSYQYVFDNETITIYDPERTEYKYGYTYISTSIPTYDKHEVVETKFIKIDAPQSKQNVENTLELFDKYNINTYTYNGQTYGFYVLGMSLSNINSIFNISFDDMSETKYFTRINGVSILDNHKYLTDMFKYIVPFMKYNILNKLYEIPIINSPYKTVFNKRYSNFIENKSNVQVKHIELNSDLNNTISLYRYYDNIIPYIYPTSIIEYDYILKTTQEKNILLPADDNLPYYTRSTNIYYYPGIRNYYSIKNNGITTYDYNILTQLEYKYYNDNKFLNLATEITIHVSDNLTLSELIQHQNENTILKYFEKYVNNYKRVKFNNNEILFLYNKYSVILLSNSIKLSNNYNEKLYTLTYKFTLN